MEFKSAHNVNRNNRSAAGRHLREGTRSRQAGQNHKKKKLPVFTYILPVAALLLTAILLIVPLKADGLKGTWSIDDITAYQFDGKGSGALVLPDSQYPFAYKISEDVLHIDFESEEARDFDYFFTLEGSRLMLTGGEGNEMVSYILTNQGS